MLEASPRQLHQGRQARTRVSIHHPGTHAGFQGTRHQRGIVVAGEHQHRPRQRLIQGGEGLQQRVTRPRLGDNHHIWCMARRVVHQIAAVMRHAQHVQSGGREVLPQRQGRRRIVLKKQYGCHKNQ
jgi:hypothetical protein